MQFVEAMRYKPEKNSLFLQNKKVVLFVRKFFTVMNSDVLL
jgi:hypothetical protein